MGQSTLLALSSKIPFYFNLNSLGRFKPSRVGPGLARWGHLNLFGFRVERLSLPRWGLSQWGGALGPQGAAFFGAFEKKTLWGENPKVVGAQMGLPQ